LCLILNYKLSICLYSADISDPKHIARENSVIENVPLGGVDLSKRVSDDVGGMSDGYQHMNDNQDTFKQMEEYDDGAYYRVLERPDLGEGVYIISLLPEQFKMLYVLISAVIIYQSLLCKEIFQFNTNTLQ